MKNIRNGKFVAGSVKHVLCENAWNYKKVLETESIKDNVMNSVYKIEYSY